MNKCVCGRIMVGGKPTDSRNWNPACPDHGLESDWYRSDEQTAKRQAENDRLRNLQRQAAEARARYREARQRGLKVHQRSCGHRDSKEYP